MTDGFEQWVVGLPMWFQTPLVVAALAVVALGVAALLLWLLTIFLPIDKAERQVFGLPDRKDRGGGDPQ